MDSYKLRVVVFQALPQKRKEVFRNEFEVPSCFSFSSYVDVMRLMFPYPNILEILVL